jgi:hypothetical protein
MPLTVRAPTAVTTPRLAGVAVAPVGPVGPVVPVLEEVEPPHAVRSAAERPIERIRFMPFISAPFREKCPSGFRGGDTPPGHGGTDLFGPGAGDLPYRPETNVGTVTFAPA